VISRAISRAFAVAFNPPLETDQHKPQQQHKVSNLARAV
jgi:hypothetical protein